MKRHESIQKKIAWFYLGNSKFTRVSVLASDHCCGRKIPERNNWITFREFNSHPLFLWFQAYCMSQRIRVVGA